MGTMSQLTVDLQWRKDRNKQPYLAGVIEFPATLDLSKGVVVLIWPHLENSEDIPAMTIKARIPREPRSGNNDKPQDDLDEGDQGQGQS